MKSRILERDTWKIPLKIGVMRDFRDFCQFSYVKGKNWYAWSTVISFIYSRDYEQVPPSGPPIYHTNKISKLQGALHLCGLRFYLTFTKWKQWLCKCQNSRKGEAKLVSRIPLFLHFFTLTAGKTERYKSHIWRLKTSTCTAFCELWFYKYLSVPKSKTCLHMETDSFW